MDNIKGCSISRCLTESTQNVPLPPSATLGRTALHCIKLRSICQKNLQHYLVLEVFCYVERVCIGDRRVMSPWANNLLAIRARPVDETARRARGSGRKNGGAACARTFFRAPQQGVDAWRCGPIRGRPVAHSVPAPPAHFLLLAVIQRG